MELTRNRPIGKIRRETAGGREYIVAPSSLIVSGVLAGSRGRLFYPPEEIRRNYRDWHGTPLLLRHPVDPITNRPQSGWDDEVFERLGLGYILNPTTRHGGRVLRGESWFDV